LQAEAGTPVFSCPNGLLTATDIVLTISGLQIQNSVGALFFVNSNVTVVNCTFIGNSLSVIGSGNEMGGAALALTAGSLGTLVDCIFINNTVQAAGPSCALDTQCVPQGGAVFSDGTSQLASVSQCTFTGNRVLSGYGGAQGGALSVFNGACVVSDSVFDENTATATGSSVIFGGAVNCAGALTLLRCKFLNNNVFVDSSMSGTGFILYFSLPR
jgi:hypothetical protein